MSEMMPWLKMNGEPNIWYERFSIFRRMGHTRSIIGALNKELATKGEEKQGSIPGAWSKASKRWKWKERAEAWDDHQRAVDEARWLKRRDELKQKEWELSEKLIDKAQQMLQFPLAATTREDKTVDGKVTSTTVVKPTRWTMADAARILKTASELARMSADMPTNRSEVIPADPSKSKDVIRLTDEQLERIAAQGLEDSGSSESNGDEDDEERGDD